MPDLKRLTSRARKYHRIIQYHLDSGDILLTDSSKEGAELAGKVNMKDPSGVPRDVAERVAKCSGGIITEKIFHDFFDRKLDKIAVTKSRLSEIEFIVPQTDRSKGQIDFIVRSKVDRIIIVGGETRSSSRIKQRTYKT